MGNKIFCDICDTTISVTPNKYNTEMLKLYNLEIAHYNNLEKDLKYQRDLCFGCVTKLQEVLEYYDITALLNCINNLSKDKNNEQST